MSYQGNAVAINDGAGPYSPYERGSLANKGYVKMKDSLGETDSEQEVPRALSRLDSRSLSRLDGDSTPLLHSSQYPRPSGSYIPRRYIISILLWFVLTIGYSYRTIMSVAVLQIKVGTWWQHNETIQGLLLSSFFAGYILTQVAAGELSRRFGPKIVYIAGFSLSAVATVVLPVAGANLPLIFICRILTGLGEGVLFPGTHAIVSYWVPPEERATLLTVIWSGVPVGNIIALATTKIIGDKLGWPFIFYIWGGLGVAWVVFWVFLAMDSPLSQSKEKGFSLLRVSNHEVNFLIERIPALSTPEQPTPWIKLISSSATWAIVAGHFSVNWTGYVLLGFLPKFLTSINYEPGSYGLIPHAGTAIVSIIAGKLADLAITKYNVKTVWVRKIWQTVGAGGSSLFMALIAALVHQQSDGLQAVIFLSFAMSIGGAVSSGYGANHIDIGPKYAGPLMGITNTVATIPGIVGIFLTGFILDHTHGSYFLVWIIAIGIYVVGTIIFDIFAVGEKVFE